MRIRSKVSPRAAARVAMAIGALSAASAHAGPAVTVYSRDLGFVREERVLELQRDRDTVLVPVPERIDFSSVRLVPVGAKLERLAYRFDVATGDGALERARGSQVRVVLRGERVVEGTLTAVDGSWLVVRGSDGSLHTLARNAADDVRIANPGDRFSLRPALEAVISGRKGNVNAELAYLTGGLSWSAEHVVVRRGESAAVWSTQVTIENTTGRDFVDATLKLVAGEPNRESGMPPPVSMMRSQMVGDMAMAEKSEMTQQAFADYHLYTLERPATLRERETQALAMLDRRDVKVKPRYLYRGGDSRGVRTQMEVVNSKAAGLGVPLPGGRVRFYETDPSGAVQFTGEATLRHTPEDEKMTLEVGSAFDLVAERRETYTKRISDREREYGVEIKLRNRKPTNVEIVVEEGIGGDFEITQKSHEFTRKDANTIEFKLPVLAGKQAVLTYVVRSRW